MTVNMIHFVWPMATWVYRRGIQPGPAVWLTRWAPGTIGSVGPAGGH